MEFRLQSFFCNNYMNMNKFNQTILAVAFIIGVNFSAFPQTLSKYIPDNAGVVFSVNANSIGKKVGMDALNATSFMKDLDLKLNQESGNPEIKLIKEFKKNPESWGINMNDYQFAWVNLDSTSAGFTYLFPLKSMSVLEDKISELRKTQSSMPNFEVIENSSIRYIVSQNVGMFYSAEYIGFTSQAHLKTAFDITNEKFKTYEEQYGDEYDNYYNKVSDSLKASEKELVVESIKTLDSRKSKSLNQNFIKNDDANVYVNSANFSSFMNSTMGNPEMSRIYGKLYKQNPLNLVGYNSELALNFNNKEIEMTVKAQYPEGSLFQPDDLFRKGIHPEFMKHINGKNTLAAYSFNINIPVFVQNLEQYIKENYKELPLDYNSTINSGLKSSGLSFDANDLKSTFSGEFLLTFNGISEIKKEYIDYSYDEDYNETQVKKTKKEPVPNMTLLMGIGNPNHINEILDLLISKNFLEKKKGFYEFVIPGNTGIRTILKKTDHYLVISNSAEMLESSKLLKKGYSKKYQNAQLNKDIASNHSFMFANLDKIMGLVISQSKDMSSKDLKSMQQIQKTFSLLEYYGFKTENSGSTTYMKAFTKGLKSNSALDILNLFDTIYSIQEGLNK